MTIKFGSLFSGVGGFDLALENVGMECAWQVENDKHCQGVLRNHWRKSKLYGDVREVGKQNLEAVNLICGGFPCQDLSVAGKRVGLKGERSGLWFEFKRIIEELRPTWVIIENVPGLLNSNEGKDFKVVLDSLEQMGYVIDCSLLDSQNFGVPQRRERIYIVCHHIKDILKKKNSLSTITIAQCLMQILVGLWVELNGQSNIGFEGSTYKNRYSIDGVKRRMSLFEITSEKDLLGLVNNLIEGSQSYQKELKNLGYPSEEELKNVLKMGIDLFDTWMMQETESLNGYTLRLWKNIWDENLQQMNLFTTSTLTNSITDFPIYIFARISLIMAWYMLPLTSLSKSSLNEDIFGLTLLRECINYGKKATRQVYGQLGGISGWELLIRFSERIEQSIVASLGTIRSVEVLFESGSSSGGAEESAGARKEDAPKARTSSEIRGGTREVSDEGSGRSAYNILGKGGNAKVRHAYPTETARTIDTWTGKDNKNAGATFIVDGLPENIGALQARDYKGVGTQFVNEGKVVAVGHSGGISLKLNDKVNTISTQVGSETTAMFNGVWDTQLFPRRLTPLETERLQGFPDYWSKHTYQEGIVVDRRGETRAEGMIEEQSDTQRYKQMGNAVTVNVVEWIGKRIMKIESEV